ncbi:phospholipase A2 inhibitor and Ly6/PLAUR domain-containing protein-like [Paroedura picta]|uniref:phospholipase A2 inhibitor and Ly6/PLAUR domain-containing protein-like n=1 Tax=Paroedura picta TaxID=143630 RepID=UPI004056A646
MKTLLSTCLLWALFSTGASMQCYSCVSITGPCDDSAIQQCSPGEDACVSLKGSATLREEGQGDDSFIKCRIKCGGMLNPLSELLFAAPLNTNVIPNGLQCPACFSLRKNNCQPKTSAPCTGEETQCVNFSGSVTAKISSVLVSLNGAFQGCITPNGCAYKPVTVGIANNTITINVTRLACSPGIIVGTPLTNSPSDYTTLPFPG